MSLKGFKILAVIPARGGSKGIPHKNLREIDGVSLIGYAANTVLSSLIIDRAIISTDSVEIINEAKKYGIESPFIRPDDLSNDMALGVDVWRHAWLESEKYYQQIFDISVFIEPTSPLRILEDIENTIQLLVDSNYPAAATVSKTPAHFTPHKTLTVSTDGSLGFYMKEGAKYSRRQGIPDYYHRNGICYAAKRNHVIVNRQTIDNNTLAVVIERPVVNIDDLFELELAEWLYAKQSKLQKN